MDSGFLFRITVRSAGPEKILRRQCARSPRRLLRRKLRKISASARVKYPGTFSERFKGKEFYENTSDCRIGAWMELFGIRRDYKIL